MTGMYGRVKMSDGERICNLSMFVVQQGYRVVEVARYYTENKYLKVHDVLDNIVWPGNVTRMPASDTTGFLRMYTNYLHLHDRTAVLSAPGV